MSLPPGLLEAFDRVSRQSGYGDRSKALQAAMRAFISDFEAGVKKGNVVGSIVMVYDHETKGTDEAHCLCALLVRGKVPDIASLEGELKREKGIMQVKSSYLETESI